MYNCTTNDYKKNEFFSLEIKDLMQKVNLSQYVSNIAQAKLQSSISYAERSFSVKSGLNTCLVIMIDGIHRDLCTQ